MTQRDRDRRLASMWNQGYLTATIAAKLGYNHGSSVSHRARQLGLPIRRGNRYSRNPSARQVRGEQAQLARLERAVLKPVGPIPTLFRCEICGGRSSTPIHSSHGVAA